MEFVEVFDFYFYWLAGSHGFGGFYRLMNTTAGGNMIFLDQESIKQAGTMVMTATLSNGILFVPGAVPEACLRGIQQFDLCVSFTRLR